MFLCETCGQCLHIGNDNFIAMYSTTGWSEQEVDCEDGDYVDTNDSETNDRSLDYYECPHCESHNIDDDSNIEPEDALHIRAEYRISQGEDKINIYKELGLASEWDD